MPVNARLYTDPACSASWAAEPLLRRLMVEFGEDVSFTYVMGGLARDYEAGFQGPDSKGGGGRDVYTRLLLRWLDRADASGMPFDPRLWMESPIRSSYPACMAVKAATEQADDGGYRYLRTLREGLMCFRRKLDTAEALVEEARRAGLDAARFRIDLESHATVEAFGADLDRARTIPDEARERGGFKQGQGAERVVFPTICFTGADGGEHWVFGSRPYEELREAALAAGARPTGESPGVAEAIGRFGRMATVEVEAVCGLPGPRAAAQLWQLATDWRVRPVPVLIGTLWEQA